MNGPNDWWDSDKAADYVGITRRVLNKWCRQGRVKFGKAGREYRFRQEDLDRAVMVGGR
ncbi:MAG: helix-turn-helix domain-containing protein [Elusimicrobiota bacterium]